MKYGEKKGLGITMTDTPNTILRPPWLPIVRAVWIVLATIYISAYFVALPARLSAQPQLVSSGSPVTQAAFLEKLAYTGISPDGYVRYVQLINAFEPFLYLVLGVFIAWRKSNDWMAFYTALLLMFFLNNPFSFLATNHPAWMAVADMHDVITSNVLFVWFFIFPNGRFSPRWMRWPLALLLAIQVWRIFQPTLYQQSFAYLAPVIFGAILISQIYRYKHADTGQRQQIKWVVFGISLGCAPLLLFFLVYFTAFRGLDIVSSEVVTTVFGGFLWTFFVLVLPVSLTLAIIRSRLFDIDVIIRRTLQYAILTGLLVLTYFGGVVTLEGLLRPLTGGARPPLVTVITTLGIAALFSPLRRRVQDLIDRRFYRQKYDAEQTLARFAATVRDEVDMEQLSKALLGVVVETIQPEKTSLWLKK